MRFSSINENKEILVDIISKIASLENPRHEQVASIISKNPDITGNLFSKKDVLQAYRQLKKEINLDPVKEKVFLQRVKIRKVRTISGVTPVTVLTKPYKCPGGCIYCPSENGLPKSYLSSEPGAQRAVANKFHPYLQVFNRLVAYKNIGHPTEKIELIVLGGTWSYYTKDYQRWFIMNCFKAMNDYNGQTEPIDVSTYEDKEQKTSWEDLFSEQKINETTQSRCVGMSLETRPDYVTKEEVERMRKLGATKVQIGVQTLSNKILRMNNRGHTVKDTKNAFDLLRLAGFKIQAHFMPNLYGSNPSKDISNFKKLFSRKFRPDELKIYPCSLIEGTDLMTLRRKHLWEPYSEETLSYVLENLLMLVPRYCRVTRVIRDISSDDIVEGNKKTNFRQIVEKKLKERNLHPKDIRYREIRGEEVNSNELSLKITKYKTVVSEEIFLEYLTKEDKIAGFLRLSLPTKENFLEELKDCSIIREVHVYGQSLELGSQKLGKAQHTGLGTKLIKVAEKISIDKKFKQISVISSVGTRKYYDKFGYILGSLYQTKNLLTP
ncbi:elongator complex protein 3 [Patescibacteria group bacterium]